MHTLYLLSVWLHILAATVWIGGMAFLVLVLVPVIRRSQYRETALGFIQSTGVQFRRVGWISLGLLLATGLFNLAYRGYLGPALLSFRFWQTGFGQVLGLKLACYGLILAISLIHDFFIGPMATREDIPENLGQKRRVQARWMGRVNLLLALIVVFLGTVLVRGWGS